VAYRGGDFNGFFEILGTSRFREDGTTPYGHDPTYHQLFLDTRTKNMYSLGVGISMVFEILGHFLFKGDKTTRYGLGLYTIRFSLTQGTNICMV
jgi:hypothetical protein